MQLRFRLSTRASTATTRALALFRARFSTGALPNVAVSGCIIPITVDDTALLEAVLGVMLPRVAIHNPKSKI